MCLREEGGNAAMTQQEGGDATTTRWEGSDSHLLDKREEH